MRATSPPYREDRGIDLSYAGRSVPRSKGDASLLIEAVSNLIDNAMKFGPALGAVRVTLSVQGGDMC